MMMNVSEDVSDNEGRARMKVAKSRNSRGVCDEHWRRHQHDVQIADEGITLAHSART